MYKLLYALALAALLVAVADLQAPAGSPAQLEAGFLLMLAPALAALGFWRHRAATRLCPKCSERVKRAALRCRHCGEEISRG